MSPLDAIVLAGGRGERLGGESKADLVLGGRRLLDHLYSNLCDIAGAHALELRDVVVVAPEDVAVPPGVARALEDPPDGGPAAGVAAGVAALRRDGLVAILTVDAPFSPLAIPALVAAAGEGGAAARSGEMTDYLLGVYPAEALRQLDPTARNISARRYLSPLGPAVADVPELALADVDTWEDAEALVVAAAELLKDVGDQRARHRE